MALKDDIKNKAKAIVDEKFVVTDVDYVPDITNTKLTFGCTGLQFESTVLFIDMRGSTKILNSHNKSTVAKIHMVYFHTIINIAKSMDGEVRSFNGDSMLVFFQGTTKNSLSNAVKAAMQMKYALTQVVNPYLEKYSSVDFGIGLDHGKVLCTKIGLGRNSNHQDLIWIGNAVNKSTVIGDKCSKPNHIGISNKVYENLNDNVKYHNRKNSWGQVEKVNMWNSAWMVYNDKNEKYWHTNYYWAI
ncbi:MAG TPA: adenylate/guanylate cyclase domain-containing protein [Bacteroidetes bacterium]|nr:adenylate/guanylate cyclase domain-containing protein [Bacteroidota bacterium]